MKKLILLLSVIAFAFTSCSKDDNNDTSQDLLIGTWTYSNSLEDGVEISLSDCEKQETWINDADGTFTVTVYDDIDGPCVENGTISGTWENSGNGVYTFTVLGIPITQQITFDSNTFFITYFEGDVEYKDVYTKS